MGNLLTFGMDYQLMTNGYIYHNLWSRLSIITNFTFKMCYWLYGLCSFQVYLRLQGSKGKLPKTVLTKSNASPNKKKKTKYKFKKGSSNVFRVSGKDIGELKSLYIEVNIIIWKPLLNVPTMATILLKYVGGSSSIFTLLFQNNDLTSLCFSLQHDGLTKADGWFLDRIEIIKRDPKSGHEKSWVFMCKNWLSLHEGDCQISRQLFGKCSSKTGMWSKRKT